MLRQIQRWSFIFFAEGGCWRTGRITVERHRSLFPITFGYRHRLGGYPRTAGVLLRTASTTNLLQYSYYCRTFYVQTTL
jgi:hypothetical protein